MKERISRYLEGTSLATKIRYSYVIAILPALILVAASFVALWSGNRRYESMINSVGVASEFSLDFKKDFDYETYLLIVGNKSPEESRLEELLTDAERVVSELETMTEPGDNRRRLSSVRKYLTNLRTYKSRIEENLDLPETYEDNIDIWENDVQIVTQLLQDAFYQYTYYETRGLQAQSDSYQTFFMRMLGISLIAFALVIVLIIILSIYIPGTITKPIRELGEVTEKVAGGDLTVRSNIRSGVETAALSDSLNVMIDKINDLLRQVTTEQTSLRKAEFELLQAQINPHFLYNTLDTIVWLAESGDEAEVVHMVRSLSDFFRMTLNGGRDIVTVREELQHTRSYLEIQQVRYRDILTYSIDVPPELAPYRIPKITLQPLVENALYHGIKTKRGGGSIFVTGKYVPGDTPKIVLCIRDTGRGMTPGRLAEVRRALEEPDPDQREIYGLYNVNQRIRLDFGEAYGLSLESTAGEGTAVTVTLPAAEE